VASPRARVAVVTALAAALFAGVVVAVAARSGGEPPPQPRAQARPGAPPLALDLGVRTDPEARDLRRALALYTAGRRAQAGAVFARYGSLEARVGRELAAWPDGTVGGLSRLAALYPKSGLVQLELGLAVFWTGQTGAADDWRQAAVLQPDSAYAVTAGNLLYPQYARNLPVFVPAEDPPAALDGKSAPEQLALLRRDAAGGTAADKILYGVALQRLNRPLSARREFDAAAAQAPDDPDALAAAAVGRFDKADPSAAFSRLGPLAKRFPRSATVRFHLGLLLLWIGSVDQAKRELRLAETAEPGSPLAREARRYLDTVARAAR
jgi:tetratricopeptide (TPR) repeat protein